MVSCKIVEQSNVSSVSGLRLPRIWRINVCWFLQFSVGISDLLLVTGIMFPGPMNKI
jgi:hypothetical protein